MTAVFLTGCARADLTKSAAREAAANTTQDALAVADQERDIGRVLPTYPSECKTLHRAGVSAGDRLDVAVVKYDRALGRANAQIRTCADWYAAIKDGFAEKETGNAGQQ